MAQEAKQTKNMKDSKKKRLAIALGISIPVVVAGATTGIVFGVKSCNSNPQTPTIDVIGAGWDQAKSKVALNTKSTIVLVANPNEQIINITSLKIGDSIITDFTFNKTTCSVIIDAKYMTSLQIQIEVEAIPTAKEVVDLDITPIKTEWDVNSTIKASDLTVKAKYSDGSLSSALTWGSEYAIASSVGGTPIADFDTTGYTFATAGSQLFEVKYLKKATVAKTFTVTVTEHQTTIEEFLKQYKKFYDENYTVSSKTKIELVFDEGGTFCSYDESSATIEYSNNVATATFNDGSSQMVIAGQAVADLETYLKSFDSAAHNFAFSVSDNEISYTVSLKSDPTQYETVKYNSNTYITDIENTFIDYATYIYSDTSLKNILYADSSFFTLDEDYFISMTNDGKAQTGTVLIPSKIGDDTVEGIAANGFDTAALSGVRFANEDNIKVIGDSAFKNCASLTSFTLPDGVTSIEQNAFSACMTLATFTIKSTSNLKTIGASAFMATVATTITLPATIVKISAQAFMGSGFTSIDMTASAKRWFQTDIETPVILDVSDPSENATKFKTGAWKDTGIEAEKLITAFIEDLSSPIFDTNLDLITPLNPVSCLNPEITVNLVPHDETSAPVSGEIDFDYDGNGTLLQAFDVPEEGADYQVNLLPIFDVLDPGSEVQVNATQTPYYQLSFNNPGYTTPLMKFKKDKLYTFEITIDESDTKGVSVFGLTADGSTFKAIENISISVNGEEFTDWVFDEDTNLIWFTSGEIKTAGSKIVVTLSTTEDCSETYAMAGSGS